MTLALPAPVRASSSPSPVPSGVKIMDHKNYELYKADEDCRAFSGQLTSSPYRFKVPREARWHVIINPHTYSGTAEFNVKLIDDAVLGA